MSLTTLALHAMGCRFEIALWGDSPTRLRAAGQEAFAEVERLEAQLSLFIPTSEVSGLNARASTGPVLVSPELFRLLRQCRELWEATEGAFDVTVGPLMRLWGFHGGDEAVPDDEAVGRVLAGVGMQHVLLDDDARTVRFEVPGMTLDLGAIGKGYAVECAGEVLRDLGISGALLHGGTSSVFALGSPPDADTWPIGIPYPLDPGRPPHVLHLRDTALSVSGVHGRGFTIGGSYYGHVLDPRTGRPTQGPFLAAVTHPSATLAEGLSTGLLVRGEALLPGLRERWPEMDAYLIEGAAETPMPDERARV